jgi:hypothetical protein
LSPNDSATTPQQCIFHPTPIYQTTKRPAIGHYVDALNNDVTHEIIVYSDWSTGALRSFMWDLPSGPKAGTQKAIPASNDCTSIANWRPEVVNHDDTVWAFWVNDGDRLCYSRYVHNDLARGADPADPATAFWEAARAIPFDGNIETWGTMDRVLDGPPSATVRNGIINLAVRDCDLNVTNCYPWVWMIQLNDAAGFKTHDGIFGKCRFVDECDGPCRDDCGGGGERANWEQRSNWVPQVPFHGNTTTGEIGALATTEKLFYMTDTSGQRHDYTFFYDPNGFMTGAAVTENDLRVWVRKSW